MSDGDDDKTRGEPAHQTDPQATGDAGLRAGDCIGRYVLISSVGQGGMGVVFLAYDPELDRKVALKLLKLGKLGTTGKQRLLREAQALARLSHPNVVPVYDVGTVDEQAFVAMEYVEGQTLKRWLKTPRPWRDVLAVMRDAGRGLAAAHAAGLVHRDFKPDNVLIGADGRIRVVDFGLAREVEDLSNPSGVTPADRPDGRPVREVRVPRRSGDGSRDEHHSLSQVTRADQIIGTPAYMAPEQIANGACDDRADQFSFGVTFYEGLYRQRPHEVTDTIDGDALATIAEKRRHPARSAAAEPPRGSDVPAWVQRIVMRALAHDPIHRFPSMEALLGLLDKDPAVTRRRWATGAAMIVVLGLGAVGFVRGQAAKRRLCDGAHDEVQKAWSAETRERVRQAFAGTNLAYADLASATLTRAARSVRRRLVKPIQRRVRGDAGARRGLGGGARSAHGVPRRSAQGALGAGVGDGAPRQRHRAGGAARRAQPVAGGRVRRRGRAQGRDAAPARRLAGAPRRRAATAAGRDAGAVRRRQGRRGAQDWRAALARRARRRLATARRRRRAVDWPRRRRPGR